MQKAHVIAQYMHGHIHMYLHMHMPIPDKYLFKLMIILTLTHLQCNFDPRTVQSSVFEGPSWSPHLELKSHFGSLLIHFMNPPVRTHSEATVAIQCKVTCSIFDPSPLPSDFTTTCRVMSCMTTRRAGELFVKLRQTVHCACGLR